MTKRRARRRLVEVRRCRSSNCSTKSKFFMMVVQALRDCLRVSKRLWSARTVEVLHLLPSVRIRYLPCPLSSVRRRSHVWKNCRGKRFLAKLTPTTSSHRSWTKWPRFSPPDVWDEYEGGQLRGIILGDSGYALRPWLMTPFGAPSTPSQRRYNSSLCKTRVLVEQVIGGWKRRFHSLHVELWIALERVPQFIVTAAMLQNICRLRGVSDENDEEMNDNQPPRRVCACNLCALQRMNTGSNMKNSIVKRYFVR